MDRSDASSMAVLGVLPFLLLCGSGRESATFVDQSKVANADAEIITRAYPVSDLVTGWPITDKSPVDFQSLVELIRVHLTERSWDETRTIHTDAGHYLVVITQTRAAHAKIDDLLTALRDFNEKFLRNVDDGKCGNCGKSPLPQEGEYCSTCRIPRIDPLERWRPQELSGRDGRPSVGKSAEADK